MIAPQNPGQGRQENHELSLNMSTVADRSVAFWQQHLPALIAATDATHAEATSEMADALPPVACALEQWGCVQIHGADSQRFLQGQLTCDVEALHEPGICFGGLCNPKGRLISNFFLLRVQENDFRLLLHRSVIDSTVATLKKYVVFFKCEVSDLSEALIISGWLEQHIPTTTRNNDKTTVLKQDNKIIAQLPIPAASPLSIEIVPVDEAASWLTQTTSARWQDNAQWELALIESGIGLVQFATQLEFVPQMLNMDLLDGISFTKGCYTGQEIVARMKYLGKQKRHMYHYSVNCEDNTQANGHIAVGDMVTDANGKALGQVVSVVASATQWEILVVLKQSPEELQTESALRIDDMSVILHNRELPYAIS